MKIGIDLDHTIINYRDIFLNMAKQWNLVSNTFFGSKNELKKRIQTNHGEKEWMRLQGYIYGKGIHGAELMPGARQFLQQCCALSIPFVIISHKTQFGHFDQNKIDLRKAARTWLEKQHFFNTSEIALQENQLFFTDTRREKLERIAKEKCTLFIDDLLEVLLASQFPLNTKRIWYAWSEKHPAQIPDAISVIYHWQEAILFLRKNHVGIT